MITASRWCISLDICDDLRPFPCWSMDFDSTVRFEQSPEVQDAEAWEALIFDENHYEVCRVVEFGFGRQPVIRI